MWVIRPISAANFSSASPFQLDSRIDRKSLSARPGRDLKTLSAISVWTPARDINERAVRLTS